MLNSKPSSPLFFQQAPTELSIVHPLFFRAKKNGATLYLLGTHHELPFTAFPPYIAQYMKIPDVLCCEQTSNTRESFLALNPFNESNYTGWYDALSPAAKSIVDTCLAPYISKIFPDKTAKEIELQWIIYLLQASMMSKSMDKDILEHFNIQKKTCYALDAPITNMDHLYLNSNFSTEFDLTNPEALSEAICNQKAAHAITSYMQDTQYEQINIMKKTARSIDSALLSERNQLWTNTLKKILEQYHLLFIAVGAMHFVGETGLLQWLLDSEFKIECINLQGHFEPFIYCEAAACVIS